MLQGIYWSSQEVRKELPCPIYEWSSLHRLLHVTLHFPSSLDTSPSPEAANCWDRTTTWLSRPESSFTRGAYSHVDSLKWRQSLIKSSWAVQAQSLRFPPSPRAYSLLSLQTQSQSVQRHTSRIRAVQFSLSKATPRITSQVHTRPVCSWTMVFKARFPTGCITLGCHWCSLIKAHKWHRWCSVSFTCSEGPWSSGTLKSRGMPLLPTSQTAAILKQTTVHLFNHSSGLKAWYLTGSMERRSSSSYWADKNYSTGQGWQ